MSGKVYLVGAGPGDVGLLTIKAKNLIESADVVLYDRLVSDDILSLIPARTKCIYVGKKPGDHSMTQENITQAMISEAQINAVVVRLKGGDPFVFGRGSEEIIGLIDMGIDYEVVPGITSALAAPAYSGIPITHRGVSTSFHVFTGHFSQGEMSQQFDFDAMVRLKGTLVFLMSVSHLPSITKGLLTHGMAPNTPAAIIENGTRAYQRRFTSTLGTLEHTAKENAVIPPSIIVIGDVAAFSDEFYQDKERPLLGKKVIVTRARAQASELKSKLQALGAKVLECPAISSQTLKLSAKDIQMLSQINRYQWIVFTSSNAVMSFFELMHAHGIDQRQLATVKFCVIGKKTKAVLSQHGYIADIMPLKFHAFELMSMLCAQLKTEDKVLRVSGGLADSTFSDELKAKGIDCDELRVYDIVSGRYYIGTEDIKRADIITFTSGSTIKYFSDYLSKIDLEPLSDVPCVVIGPTTAEKARLAGYQRIIQSDEHTIDGVVTKVIESVGKHA